MNREEAIYRLEKFILTASQNGYITPMCEGAKDLKNISDLLKKTYHPCRISWLGRGARV